MACTLATTAAVAALGRHGRLIGFKPTYIHGMIGNSVRHVSTMGGKNIDRQLPSIPRHLRPQYKRLSLNKELPVPFERLKESRLAMPREKFDIMKGYTPPQTGSFLQRLFQPTLPPNPFKRPQEFHSWLGFQLGPGIIFGLGAFAYAVVRMGSDVPDVILAFQSEYATDKLVDLYLEELTRFAVTNNTMKRILIEDPAYMERIFSLVYEAKDERHRNYACKLLDYLSQDEAGWKVFIERGYHKRILTMLNDPNSSKFLQKSCMMALANLVSWKDCHEELCMIGTIGALERCLHDESLFRHRTRRAVLHLCGSVYNEETRAVNPDVLRAVKATDKEEDLIRQYAIEYFEARKSPWFNVTDQLISAGFTLYLHTALGGAVYGLMESWRARHSLEVMVGHMLRTSLVTCLVPITVIGGMVTAYNTIKKRQDEADDVFFFHYWSFASLIVCWYGIPIVELISPYWLGGHVVGFMSFFTYLMLTNADIFRTDHILELDEYQNLHNKHGDMLCREQFIIEQLGNPDTDEGNLRDELRDFYPVFNSQEMHLEHIKEAQKMNKESSNTVVASKDILAV